MYFTNCLILHFSIKKSIFYISRNVSAFYFQCIKINLFSLLQNVWMFNYINCMRGFSWSCEQINIGAWISRLPDIITIRCAK